MLSNTKRSVSDDDESSQGAKKMRHKSPSGGVKKSKVSTNATQKPARTMDDFNNTIDDAVREQRIDNKKAARLQECLQSGDWSEVAFSMMCEQIPLKRKGKGYCCRVCAVPTKGHICPYCHVCSTAENKFMKSDLHVCFHCPACFDHGKKKKKLVQIKTEGHDCPHKAAALPKKWAKV